MKARTDSNVPASRGRPLLGCLGLVLALVLVACAGETATSTTSGGGSDEPTTTEAAGPEPSTTEGGGGSGEQTEVIVGWTRSPNTLDVGKAVGSEDVVGLENVYDSLTRRAADGSPEPRLATSWEYSEDGTAVTIHLREGVLFHNGDTMTSEDVKFSLERLIDPEYPGEFFRTDHQNIESIDIVDDYTLTVNFTAPSPLWMQISPTRTPIVPAEYAQSLGYDEFGSSPETTVGTGPYRPVNWVLDDRLELEAFDDYWEGPPAIGRVVIRTIPDPSARVAALLAGDVDVIHAITSEQLSAIESSPDAEVRTVTGIARTWITWNAHARENSPLADVRVREALSLAVDLKSIIDNLLGGLGELAPIVAVPVEVGYNGDLEPYPYDPDRARELLAEAGYGDGINGLQFLVRDLTPNADNVAQAIQAMWADVGVNVDITVADAATFTARHEQKDLDLSLWVYRAGTAFHAGHAMRDVFGCEAAHAFWKDEVVIPEACELLDQAYAVMSSDSEAANEIFNDAQRILWENFASGGVISQPNIFGVDKNLVWTPSPIDDNWMYAASWGS